VNDLDELKELAGKQRDQIEQYDKWEQQLLRMVSRLCVISIGTDPDLDPFLKDIRVVSKKGVSYRLEESFKTLSDAMMRAEDKSKDPTLFERLINQIGLPDKNKKILFKLWQEAKEKPNKVDQKILSNMVALLGLESAEVGEDTKSIVKEKKGFLGKLFSSDSTSSEDDKSPSLILAEIMSRYSWPAFINDEMDSLLGQLKEDGDHWADVLDRISHLVVNALTKIENESEATESFLTQLTKRLAEIDSYVANQGIMRKASQESGQLLDKKVQAEVGSISDEVNGANDIDEMRGLVLNRIDTIQQHVQSHLTEEQDRFEQAEEREQALSKELSLMEQDKETLQKKIIESELRAMQDALTELPNRRAYDERIETEIARFKRFNEPLSLVVWDIDNFKSINDKFGHKAGDKALQVLAKTIKDRLRETDFLARYGGEEFVMLFTATTTEQAESVADSIRQAVEGIGLHSRKQPVILTVSGGLTQMIEGDDAGSLFDRADKGLYKAKSTGKNRIVIS